jgi:hypothetical protein
VGIEFAKFLPPVMGVLEQSRVVSGRLQKRSVAAGKVKPGNTGRAPVSGHRGETETAAEILRCAQND